jgi:hypothetical protein
MAAANSQRVAASATNSARGATHVSPHATAGEAGNGTVRDAPGSEPSVLRDAPGRAAAHPAAFIAEPHGATVAVLTRYSVAVAVTVAAPTLKEDPDAGL